MKSDFDSGRISIESGVLRYQSRTYHSWELSLDRVRIFGEMTNENGPLADDYWICFADGPGRWYDASFYANGRDDVLQVLSDRYGMEMEFTLIRSTDFRSSILWPPELAGQPMFAFVEVERTSVIGRMADRLFGTALNTLTYTDEVKAFLDV